MESELTTRRDGDLVEVSCMCIYSSGWIVKLVFTIRRQLWLLEDSCSAYPHDTWKKKALLGDKWPGLLRNATSPTEELR